MGLSLTKSPTQGRVGSLSAKLRFFVMRQYYNDLLVPRKKNIWQRKKKISNSDNVAIHCKKKIETKTLWCLGIEKTRII